MEGLPKRVEKQVDQATKETDPTTYSILPTGEKRTKILRNPFVQLKIPLKTDGRETYFELNNEGHHSPKGQQAVSRMLKGILNVADVISEVNEEGVKKYYSLDMPYKNIEKESTADMVKADQMLLAFIFGSTDHRFNANSGYMDNGSFKKNRVTHFDFGEDAYDFLREPYKKNGVIGQIQYLEPETLLYLKERVTMLKDRFDGEEGRAFFDSIIKSTGERVTDLFGPKEEFVIHSDKDPEDLVYETLIERTDAMLELISSVETT